MTYGHSCGVRHPLIPVSDPGTGETGGHVWRELALGAEGGREGREGEG